MKREKIGNKAIKRKEYISILIIIIGILIIAYPVVSQKWNEYAASKMIETYDSAVEGGSIDLEAERQRAIEYNNKLTPRDVPDSFAIKDKVRDENYESILNITKNGIMGYIEIPLIDVEIPIYHYTTDDVLQKGVGHLPGSSLPVGGNGTHAVLSAHRGLPTNKLFSDLDLLEEGDNFYLKILDKTLQYEVDQVLTVDPEDTKALELEENKDYVTLVTCTPYGVNTHRLLVRGHRVPYSPESKDATKINVKKILLICLCVLIGIILAAVIIIIAEAFNKKRQNNKKS